MAYETEQEIYILKCCLIFEKTRQNKKTESVKLRKTSNDFASQGFNIRSLDGLRVLPSKDLQHALIQYGEASKAR